MTPSSATPVPPDPPAAPEAPVTLLDARARLVVAGGALLIRGLAATWRFRRIATDHSVIPGVGDGRPRLYAFWHAQMLPLLALHRDTGLAVLISAHRDGEMIARAAQRFGFEAIRGSTTRGATRALRSMERALSDGRSVAVTPDGPRGPAEVFAPGVLIAAHLARVPIVLGAAVAGWSWRLPSWDRFLVPKPFARIVVAYSDAIAVDADTPRAAARGATEFQDRLNAINAQAHAG